MTDQHGPTLPVDGLDLLVVVPCHNVEATLARQLDALVAERWNRPWGIVVVDNNSTDNTAQVAGSYSDRGVAVLTANSGRGVAYARNAGAAYCETSAVAFCDGDDVVQPGWVAAVGNALDTFDLAGGTNDPTALNPPWLAKSRPMGAGGLPTFGKLHFVPGGNGGMRSIWHRRLGGYDEAFVGLEDIEFSLRALASGAKLGQADGAVLSYQYRESIIDVWKQGFFYGRGRPALIRQAQMLGLDGPGQFDGLKSWAWLFVHLPDIAARSGRFRLTWVLANRIGVLAGAMNLRKLYV